MNEIPSKYNPKETEDKWYKIWEEHGYFHGTTNPEKKPYSIVIPPPNVTGILHMGHALNNTIQDILIRYHRMKGYETLWMPGTDHAGIATQNVVEKRIAREGLKRQDLGREEFIKRVWQWREEYGSTIIRQLKKLGASCDWERTRFTMDEEYSRAVTEVFVRLYERGLIYRGNRIINWCPRCQTALSDEEAPHHEISGALYYIRYPLKKVEGGRRKVEGEKEFIVVATTRPETMLGDTAVAVNPKDKRYKGLIGGKIVLPLTGRQISIIADEMVDMKFGTGAVKITPAHDPNDYAAGRKYNLEFINVMHPDGRMNELAGEYAGMDRFEAREVILQDLREQGLVEKIEPHQLSAGHCYRCHTIIEPYLSKQWFVKMQPLSIPAIDAVKKGEITFHPRRWTKVYLNWMENIQDWCISRQIWWGHRLPVYYCDTCSTTQVSRIRPEKCPQCGSDKITQDEDVLDTWFSSWLWPFATFGWPDKGGRGKAEGGRNEDLEYFYPTAALVTAPEIIFFWVARMIMAGFEFMGGKPFSDVYIHGTVRDIEGKKMSKSLGNVIDPLEIIGEYGTDALRFSLISITAQGQDVFLAKERFEQGRNFANKIWNASRFIMMNLDPAREDQALCAFLKNEKPGIVNRWILSRFYSALKETGKLLDAYKFNEAAQELYGFFWHEFCDWYLEIIKPDIKNPHNQLVMRTILEKFLRTAHPFMPFITEEIWQMLQKSTKTHDTGTQDTSIMARAWPRVQEQIIDRKLEKQAAAVFSLVTQIRNLRGSLGVKTDDSVTISLHPHTQPQQALIRDNESLIRHLAKVNEMRLLDTSERPAATLSALIDGIDVYLHYTGLIDIAKERAKTQDDIMAKEKSIAAKEGRLSNQEFIKRAPEEIIAKEKESMEKLKAEVHRLKKMLEELT